MNKELRSCLLHYYEWRTYTESNDSSICVKMDYNILIMVHQIKQIVKYLEADDKDPWKSNILQDLKGTKYENNFMACFYGT